MFASFLQLPKRSLRHVLSVSYRHDYGSIPVIKGDFKAMPEKVQKYVAEKAKLMNPRAIYICDGSPIEYKSLVDELEQLHMLKRLHKTGPGVFLARSDPEDTKRVEDKTVVCTSLRGMTEGTEEGVPSKAAQWISPEKFQASVDSRFPNCMKGRVMYVVPFSMGPLGGAHSLNSVQVTDSLYVVAHMHILTRVDTSVWEALAHSDFISCTHSVGLPEPVTAKLHQNWLCNVEKLFIGHEMDKKEIWSYGSSSIGNAMLGKKCLSLRMGSALGRDEGWLAEHMAIISVTNPNGKEFFVGVGFPSGNGKTVIAAMKPHLPGWKIEAIGDDAAWLRFCKDDGQMYAINPENGMYGIANATNHRENSVLLDMTSKDTIFTNIAETSDGRRWWQGLDVEHEQLPANVSIINWLGRDLGPMTKELLELQNNTSADNNKIAYNGARFAAGLKQCPNIHPLWNDPKGVPLSAIIYGCRRSNGVPLVTEALSWKHGIFMAASMRTENPTKDRTVQHDAMGMRPFLGYNLAHYVKHWLNMEQPGRKLPKIFFANWYRRDASSDKLLWPGFNENIRVLDWITRRLESTTKESSKQDSVVTQLGIQPSKDFFNLEGIDDTDWTQLMSAPVEFWKEECQAIETYFTEQMGKEEVPEEMINELNALKRRIKA